MKLTFCLLLILLPVAIGKYRQYYGDSVIRLYPEDSEEWSVLNMYIRDQTLDVWHTPSHAEDHMDVQVNRMQRKMMEHYLEEEGLVYFVMIEDVQDLISEPVKNQYDPGQLELDTSRYHDLDEISDWMDDIAERCGDDCETEIYGTSYDGRNLKLIKITRPGADRRAVWLDCGIHAREWISPAVCSYLVARLINDFGEDEDVNEMREAYDWYVVPVVNVDGYDFTWTDDRLWRKTRSPNDGSTCMGTDANRNFGVGWGGASPDPCSQTYMGASAQSEVEIQALDDYMTANAQDRFDLLLTFHSYGAWLILPWGYTSDVDPDDMEELEEKASIFIAGINEVNGYGFYWARSGGGMPGNTIDWGKLGHNIKYSYLLELRDNGQNDFLLPPDQILPSVLEVWNGLKDLTKEMIED